MAHTYTSSGVSLSLPSTYTALYTCPPATTAMLNSIYFCNRNIATGEGQSTAINLRLYDSISTNFFQIVSGVDLPSQASIQPISAPLVLKAGDAIQVADASGWTDVTSSVLEIT